MERFQVLGSPPFIAVVALCDAVKKVVCGYLVVVTPLQTQLLRSCDVEMFPSRCVTSSWLESSLAIEHGVRALIRGWFH